MRLFQTIPEGQWKHIFQDLSSFSSEQIEQALKVLQIKFGMSDEQMTLFHQSFEGLQQDAREGGYKTFQEQLAKVSPEQLADISRFAAQEMNTGKRLNPIPAHEPEQHPGDDYQALIAKERLSLTSSQITRLVDIANEAGRQDFHRLINLLTRALEDFASLPVPCMRISLYLERAHAYLQILQSSPSIQAAAASFIESGLKDCNEALAIPIPGAARLLHTHAHMLRGAFYAVRLAGIRQDNLKQALADFDTILQRVSYETQPEIWTKVYGSRALARFELYKGGSRQELEELTLELETALSQYFPSSTKDGEIRALLKTAEAQTYMQLYLFHTGDTRKTLDQIIQSCDDALKVLTREHHPYEWAALHQTRGLAYTNRSQGHLEKNLELAIENCQKALQVFGRENRPYEWAMTHFTLSYAYFRRVTGDREENLRLSIDHCNTSLQVLTSEAYPAEWRHVMPLYNDIRQQFHFSNPDYAWRQEEPYIEEILKDQDAPEGSVAWANIQVSQGDAYADRDGMANKEQAIKYYDQALTIFTRKSTPLLWATTLVRRAITKHRLRPPQLDEILHASVGPFQSFLSHSPVSYWTI